MTDDPYRDLTPTQRAVRDAFRRDPGLRGGGVIVGRVAAATGLPLDTVRRTLHELQAIATRYWLGKGAAA